MKIINKINTALNNGNAFFSFEYFPPKTDEVSIFKNLNIIKKLIINRDMIISLKDLMQWLVMVLCFVILLGVLVDPPVI